jgi:methylase of polypeptide subunit release factors
VEALVDRGQTERLIETARFGWLVLEVHEARAAEIAHKLDAAGYRDVSVSKDLAGRDRIVEGRWIP